MLTYRIGGSERLRKAVADLRATPEWIKTAVVRELQGIPAGLRPKVQVEMARVLPARYAPVLAAALRITAAAGRKGWISVRIKGQARGRRKLRDVSALDTRGALRHPVYGQGTVWSTTQVRPGLWSRPADAHAPTIINEVGAAVGRVADRLERG